MVRTILSYLTLKYISPAFTDSVSGKPVSYYKDCYGEVWMKESRWGLFRVKAAEWNK